MGSARRRGCAHQETCTCRSHIRVASTCERPRFNARLDRKTKEDFPGLGLLQPFCAYTPASLLYRALPAHHTKTATSHSMREGVRKRRGRGRMRGRGGSSLEPSRACSRRCSCGVAVRPGCQAHVARNLVAHTMHGRCDLLCGSPKTSWGKVAAASCSHTQDKPMSTGGDADLPGHIPRDPSSRNMTAPPSLLALPAIHSLVQRGTQGSRGPGGIWSHPGKQDHAARAPPSV